MLTFFIVVFVGACVCDCLDVVSTLVVGLARRCEPKCAMRCVRGMAAACRGEEVGHLLGGRELALARSLDNKYKRRLRLLFGVFIARKDAIASDGERSGARGGGSGRRDLPVRVPRGEKKVQCDR